MARVAAMGRPSRAVRRRRAAGCGTGLTVEVCWAPAVGVGAAGADARPAGGFHLRRGGRVRAPPYRRAHGNAGILHPPPPARKAKQRSFWGRTHP
jgi:hypothetical protein